MLTPDAVAAKTERRGQGFQYASPLIDGDDLLFAIRTSRDRTSQHDNELVTFHRLRNFRDYAIDLSKRNDPP